MATQTGSISFEAVGGFSSYASGEFTTTEDVAQMAQPNLSPFFSHPLTDIYNADENPDGYWANNLTGGSTPLSDGWNHYEFSNTYSSTRWLTIYEHCAWRHANGDLKGDTEYTVLMEFRNVTKTGNVTAAGITTHATSWSSMFRTTAASQAVAEGATLYFTSKTVADPSSITGNSTSTRTLLTIPAGASISCDLRVSLYEGEYSGPYKPYVDQTLITRVSTAETAIEQNAENILLRATKTETYQSAQPNLTPYFSAAKDDVYNATTNPNGYWSRITTNSQFTTYTMEEMYNGSGGWAHFAGNATSNNPFVRFEPILTALKPSTTYTFLVEWDGTFSNSGNVNLQLFSGKWQSDAVDPFAASKGVLLKGTDAATSPQYVTVSTRADMSEATVLGRSYLQVYGTGAFDCYVRISLYEGEYSGPYKPYSGTQLYASQAQLKVANDEIDLRVEKSGVIAAINASTEAEGGSAVKISADKVNIEGAAIFTSGRLSQSSLNDAYDAKGAAATVQGNLDNLQVGGRNLLLGTATPLETTQTGGTNKTFYWDLSDYGLECVRGKVAEYTVSYDWETTATSGTIKQQINATPWTTFNTNYVTISSTNQSGHLTSTITAPSTWATSAFNKVGVRLDNITGDLKISNFKLERGNRASDWTPAPEEIEANAVKRTQRIWWRATESGAPSKLTRWLATSGTGYGNWSLSVPKLTSGTTKYPYLYTAVQTQTVAQQAAGNTCSCSPVLLDETTTVIDGGTIITGSVHANSLDADSVKANIVQTTDLSASKITSGDIATERMSANVVKAVKAKVSDLYALVAKIGGFIIDATSIRTAALTSNADNSIALSTADFTRTVNGTSRAGLRFAIGDKFGVTGDGTLYAHGANIVGINAGNISSGSISADRIKANVINAVNNGTGTINADKVNVSAIKIGDLDGASTVVSNATNGKAAYDRHTAYRGTCSTAAGTAAKVVACTGFALATGATVEVYCSTANTADVPTLNVNSTGGKPIWINGAVASASNPCKWLAGDTVTFTYDGSEFRASLPVEGYVTEGTGGGLMVHRKSDATTGVKITDSVDVMRNGVSMAMFGTDENNQPISRVGLANAGHTEQKSGSFDIYVKDEATQDILKAVSIHSRTSSGTLNTLEFYAEQNNSIAIDAEDFPDDDVMGPQLYIDTYSATPNRITGVAIQASAMTAGSEYKSARIYVEVQQDGTRKITFGADRVWFFDDVIQGDAIASLPASKLTGTIADSNLPTMGSAGTAGTPNATSGATLAVPYVTTDAYGRVTAKGTHTHTIGSLDASAVTSGTFDAARIPNLDASKINSGTFDAARIPNLNASKVNDGTLDSARLPTVPVDKGGTGQTGVEKTTDVAAAMSAASGVTISAAQVATWGKVMQVLITAKATAAKSGTWTVGTMTAGHRPELVTFGTSNLAAIEQCRMSTDGAVSVAGTLAANASVSLTFTYLLA